MRSDDPHTIWSTACERARGRVLARHFERQGAVAVEEARRLVGLAHVLAGVACAKCRGEGEYLYPHGSTWRGGMGVAAMTVGVCDECWGTGRTDRTGADLRTLEAALRVARRESYVQWLANRVGASMASVRPELRKVAEKLRRARWGGDFGLHRTAECVANALEEMSEEPKP